MSNVTAKWAPSDRPTCPCEVDPTAAYRAAAERNALRRAAAQGRQEARKLAAWAEPESGVTRRV